ncbi:MAG: L,D-transpeptidase [Candidatus Aminicenantes bacterium]|nr:L,D-transpeptidase [Candidatus Aminicenantes bacterium]MDH5383999.1 L,D-transpeptidase [Candidatus Aminicenantes bacterium]MDH5742146.1 L,D-transpeptidase [Candidatus Aminicenantes bacterium]
MKGWILAGCIILTLFAGGCKTKPVPPEVHEAELQEMNLWRAGASIYAPEDYNQYLKSLREAKDKLIQVKAKFPWLRNYQETQLAFQNLLDTGNKLLQKVEDQKQQRSEAVSSQISSFTKRIDNVKKLSRMIHHGRFARTLLIRTELRLMEANLLHKRGEIEGAEKKLKDVILYLKDAEDLVFSVLERYRDRSFLEKWDIWLRETISESEQKGIFAIIVTKIDRKLVIYKNGKPTMTFDIGLGPNSLADKIHVGDYATPEGKYRIIEKIPKSQYYKALLLDYPNEEDRKRFQVEKKEGIIPPGVGIGGLIEIHGGGKDSITNGCISIENDDLDRIFDLIDIGTPVTIVGSTRRKNEIFFRQ